MDTISIGIDPGKHGAIAYFRNKEFIRVIDVPLIGGEVDAQRLSHVLSTDWMVSMGIIEAPTALCKIEVAIELVHALFGAAAKATFNFGYVCGLIEGIVAGYLYSYRKVQPKAWQKISWLGIPEVKKAGKKTNDSKAMSRLALNRLYPAQSLNISKSKDGHVDAILIGHWLVNSVL
jgi:hypothetical protein